MKNKCKIEFCVEDDKFIICFFETEMSIIVWIGDSIEMVRVSGKISAEALSVLFLKLVDNKKKIEDETDIMIKKIIEKIIEEVMMSLKSSS